MVASQPFHQSNAIALEHRVTDVTHVSSKQWQGPVGHLRVSVSSSSASLPINRYLDGATAIGDCAFRRCGSLISIVIPDSITSIGNGAFSGCTSLAAVHIPDSVTSIGRCAFSGCSSLAAVHIPESVTSIRDWAFSKCTMLTAVHIPDSVTSIGEYAVSGCTSLVSVHILDSVTSIGNDAFDGCISLAAVHIPDSITSISSWAFYGTVQLARRGAHLGLGHLHRRASLRRMPATDAACSPLLDILDAATSVGEDVSGVLGPDNDNEY